MGAKWQIHNNNKHYKYRERSQNNKNNVKIFKFNVNVRICVYASIMTGGLTNKLISAVKCTHKHNDAKYSYIAIEIQHWDRDSANVDEWVRDERVVRSFFSLFL